jgi:hypothetical protein
VDTETLQEGEEKCARATATSLIRCHLPTTGAQIGSSAAQYYAASSWQSV